MARTHLSGSPALHEELEALAHAYHLLEARIAGAEPDGAERLELEEELLRLHRRFERVLEESVRDEAVREQWHAHLHSRGPVPAQPPAVDPVVFRGESDSGSVVEIRRRGDELAVRVDGEPVDALDDPDELRTRRPGLTVRVGGTEFHETFEASSPAIHALAEWAETGRMLPWEHVAELLEDGLVDPHLDITHRGRRAIPAPA